ncbi:MAG: alginate O-acetyltransferase complex protein AlgI [Solirubrobacteraceae bacterium]|jgi:D-alanyl-lipoteichoic acid acyltransferase DltB (MBOAT superfamily)|nr:alginate O-acetyltransferase complex protein AlgI [Solirubrobacteraceae bacterium]
MVFPTVQFALYLPIVLTISWLLMPHPRFWKPFMLVASYVFYGAAGAKFCIILGAMTLGNQFFATQIGRANTEVRRKRLVRVAVTLDLAVLGVFKYYGFFATEINNALDNLGLGLSAPLAAIAIPLGVSFFTFQAISYTVDVYRRVIEPAKLIDVALYLSFFPHVVAGPIVRAREFLPQLTEPRRPENIPVGAATGLIILGLIKKVVIADYLARTICDPVFAVPQAYHTPDIVLACWAYGAQIFCDFSGYTDIAIGVALLFGFVFPQNFHRPYAAQSIAQYWRDWHMTLSRFFRDFVYIPLGGNRGGTVKHYRNLWLTMTVAGLWHGAAFTYVVWGMMHGTGLVIERGTAKLFPRTPAVLKWFFAFNFISAGWILFRGQTFGLAGDMFKQVVDWGPATMWTVPVVAMTAIVVGLQLIPERWIEAFRLRFESMTAAPLGVALAAAVILVVATVPSAGVPPFIYFQF